MRPIDILINKAPGDLHDRIEAALEAFADKLFAVEKTFHGELGSDARVVWLTAQSTRIDTARSLRQTLQHVSGVASWIDNWSENAKAGSPETDGDWTVVNEAGEAATDALKALHALVDFARENTKRVPATVEEPRVVGV